MNCHALPIAPLTKGLPNSVEILLEEEGADFTGWTIKAEVHQAYEQGMRLGELLFTPTFTLKAITAADAANDIPAALSYSVEFTAEQTESLYREDAVLTVIFVNDSGIDDDIGRWRLETCLLPSRE